MIQGQKHPTGLHTHLVPVTPLNHPHGERERNKVKEGGERKKSERQREKKTRKTEGETERNRGEERKRKKQRERERKKEKEKERERRRKKEKEKETKGKRKKKKKRNRNRKKYIKRERKRGKKRNKKRKKDKLTTSPNQLELLHDASLLLSEQPSLNWQLKAHYLGEATRWLPPPRLRIGTIWGAGWIIALSQSMDHWITVPLEMNWYETLWGEIQFRQTGSSVSHHIRWGGFRHL